MYKTKKKPSKRFTPVRGSRAMAQKVKQILFIISLFALVALMLLGVQKIAAAVFAGEGPAWALWRVKKITITGESKDMQYEVSKYIGFEEGDVMTYRDAENLQALLLGAIRSLENVKVRRKIFSKELLVKIKKRNPFALLSAQGRTFYAAGDGVLFTDPYPDKTPGLLRVALKGEIKSEFLSQELVKLIKEFSACQTLTFEELEIDRETRTVTFTVPGAARVTLEGYGNGAAKLRRLAEVIQTAGDKNLKKPYEINLNYFEDGKIYLKAS
jgi:cell division septal protein FtsQ